MAYRQMKHVVRRPLPTGPEPEPLNRVHQIVAQIAEEWLPYATRPGQVSMTGQLLQDRAEESAHEEEGLHS